jgi:hypothetical protein
LSDEEDGRWLPPAAVFVSGIIAVIVLSSEDSILCFDLVLDGGPSHDSIEFHHRGADAGRYAAAAAPLPAFAAQMINHAPHHQDGHKHERSDGEN